MRIDSLKITNVRALEVADFTFGPGFNLMVGINGVGKTTALDALRFCVSRFLPSMSPSKARAQSFAPEDIRMGAPYLEAGVTFHYGTKDCKYERREWHKTLVVDDPDNIAKLRRNILDNPRLSDRARNLLRELETTQTVTDTDFFEPSKAGLRKLQSESGYAPICIFFGVQRSIPSNKSASASARRGGQAAAYADALVSRPLYLTQIAQWMRAQQQLAPERPISAKHLEVLTDVARQFLPDLTNLRVDAKDGNRLLVDKGGLALDAAWLSEGERGVLAMALDIARRLSQANPNLEDPAKEAGAVVLIDEIDLHLHPRLQREIIHRLTTVFPKCQFIATTHSPQVISEVAHDRVQIMTPEGVYSPSHSFGIDSSRVLEEIMDATPRPRIIEEKLQQIARLSHPDTLDEARKALDELADKLELGENDPEVTRLRTLLDFMGGEP